MIVKGVSTRRNGRHMADYLTDTERNDAVRILYVSHATSEEPEAALREFMADREFETSLTRGEKGLRNIVLNPEDRYGHDISDEQWLEAAGRAVWTNGLRRQPYAVVLHGHKDAGWHAHVVASRVDLDKQKLISDSFKRRDEIKLARELEKEWGHAPVERKAGPVEQAVTDRDRQMTPAAPAAVKERITKAWRASDSPQAFMAALDEAGVVTARGDRRGYVAVDENKKVHALQRQVVTGEGKTLRAGQLRAFLESDYPLQDLPSVEEAKQIQERRLTDPERNPDLARRIARVRDKHDARLARLDSNEERKRIEQGGLREAIKGLRDYEQTKRPGLVEARREYAAARREAVRLQRRAKAVKGKRAQVREQFSAVFSNGEKAYRQFSERARVAGFETALKTLEASPSAYGRMQGVGLFGLHSRKRKAAETHLTAQRRGLISRLGRLERAERIVAAERDTRKAAYERYMKAKTAYREELRKHDPERMGQLYSVAASFERTKPGDLDPTERRIVRQARRRVRALQRDPGRLEEARETARQQTRERAEARTKTKRDEIRAEREAEIEQVKANYRRDRERRRQRVPGMQQRERRDRDQDRGMDPGPR